MHITGPRECPSAACITHHVAGGGGFLRFGNGLCICVLDTSCHTAGHVSYIMTEAVILVTVSVEMERG